MHAVRKLNSESFGDTFHTFCVCSQAFICLFKLRLKCNNMILLLFYLFYFSLIVIFPEQRIKFGRNYHY